MRIGLITKKVGMSRYFDTNGINHPVTILQVNKCEIVEVKTLEKNGYQSVKLASGSTKNVNKPTKGFLKKNNVSLFKYSREFRVSNLDSYKVGSEVKVNNFIEGQFVDVCSNSIGKGFAGGMKRHNFAGNRATHGVSISHRSHGSTGQCQDPGKVFKGKKMAGRLGNKKITVQNLKVLKVDIDNNILLIKGAVPGHKGAVISVFDSVKKRQNIKPDQDNNLDQGSEVDAKVTPNLANDNIQEKKTEQVQAKIVEQNDPEDKKKTSENRKDSENKEQNSNNNTDNKSDN